MTDEVEWWDYEDAAEMGEALAGDVQFIIESAIDARGSAVIATPGGTTPAVLYKHLAKAKLDWKRVTIVPTDDRLVPMGDPLSNVTGIAKIFLPLGARVIPITSEKAEDYKAAGRAADARLKELHWPLDLCLLGIGADGHTASIFPGPDLDEALNGPKDRRALGVMPEPLPPEAPVARVTLSLAAITSARALMVALIGEKKKAVLEAAIREGTGSPYPIGRVLAAAELPVDIHWSA
ncbi:6-phosphogluconolactonase [Sphingomonas sp.]|uniref:6-phosphogluconolactonase n=1 Tax=Sphingomonas sp. TaxID=28214 RepID=UPI001B277899|nr:6-phosphogluconolactonase [Sphingomonas sp.]MBO9712129.1 6-phosphogluconolactonase [Sphingomonas sp.]